MYFFYMGHFLFIVLGVSLPAQLPPEYKHSRVKFSLHLPYTLRTAEALFSIWPLDAVQVYSPLCSTVTFSTMSVLDSSREFHSFFL